MRIRVFWVPVRHWQLPCPQSWHTEVDGGPTGKSIIPPPLPAEAPSQRRDAAMLDNHVAMRTFYPGSSGQCLKPKPPDTYSDAMELVNLAQNIRSCSSVTPSPPCQSVLEIEKIKLKSPSSKGHFYLKPRGDEHARDRVSLRVKIAKPP